ncbi:hypothetical protein Lalb_Chr16g0392001 [Lupinus albus]|uniref:Uncharacterized protein n=1 Tax=Lupinus albus TaxID=3870 RepID=A0A6A4P8F1_LUPAL|nr:hypothetical protein Lalb_Chr16g0392001 [Lupinus albus]
MNNRISNIFQSLNSLFLSFLSLFLFHYLFLPYQKICCRCVTCRKAKFKVNSHDLHTSLPIADAL